MAKDKIEENETFVEEIVIKKDKKCSCIRETKDLNCEKHGV